MMRPEQAPLALIVCAALLSQGRTQPPPSAVAPRELVRQIVQNELYNSNGHVLSRYWERHETPGRSELREVVQIDDGCAYRVVSINGHPLSQQEWQKENQRIGKISASSDQQRRLARQSGKETEQMIALIKLLPDAFLYEYDGDENGLVRLRFTPDPGFRPPSREALIFRAMAGTMLMDVRHKRFVGMSGALINDVRIGGGLLGVVYKGGHFSFERAEVAGGGWSIISVQIQIEGKVLFIKSLVLNEKDTRFGFQEIHDRLTFSQAAALLQQDAQYRAVSARK